VRSAPPQRRKVDVSLDDVLDAAIQLADRHGFDALSIRAVAASLELSPMSLYRFVTSKDDLVDRVAIRIMDRVELPQAFASDWRNRIVVLMRVWRDLFLAHPSVVQILASRRTSAQSEGLARLMEGVLANLETAGIRGERAVEAFWQIFTFTFGHVVFELPRLGEQAEADHTASQQLNRIALERGFDRVAGLSSALTSSTTRPTFEHSLALLLEGIASTVAAGEARPSMEVPSARELGDS
jgi:AcrR family transcriptional regulator